MVQAPPRAAPVRAASSGCVSPFEGDGNETAWMSVADDRPTGAGGLVPGPRATPAGPFAAAAARPRPVARYRVSRLARTPTTRSAAPTRWCAAATSSWRVGLFLDDHAWEAQARGDFQARLFELEARRRSERRGDDLAVGEPFRVGVNYWPRRKAMGWWKALRPRRGRRRVRRHRRPGPVARPHLPALGGLPADAGRRCRATALRRPRDGLRRRRGPRPGPRRDVLHRPHERTELGAAVAARRRASRSPAAARSSAAPTMTPAATATPSSIPRRSRRGRAAGRARSSSACAGHPARLGLEPRQRAGPLRAARRRACRARLGAQRSSRPSASYDDRTPVTVGLHARSACMARQRACAWTACSATADIGGHARLPASTPTSAPGRSTPTLVPFAAALTASLVGQAGARWRSSAPARHRPASRRQTWQWQALGRDVVASSCSPRRTLAEHLEAVLPRLVEVGATRRAAVVLRRLRPRPSGTSRPATRSSTSATSASSDPTARSSRTPRSSATSSPPRRASAEPSPRARMARRRRSFYADPASHAAGPARGLHEAGCRHDQPAGCPPSGDRSASAMSRSDIATRLGWARAAARGAS